MASNVFGNPITNFTLASMPDYAGKIITRSDRVKVALDMKNAVDKDVNARTYVENLKKDWGDGDSTLCLIYNATGDTVTFVTSHNWFGHIGPSPYPIEIANGQWGGYLHVKTSGAAIGSTAAVVYRGKNGNGTDCDWMLAWSNPWNRDSSDNTVYTEIQEARYFETDRWNSISSTLYQSGIYRNNNWNGCSSYVATGSGTTAVFEAILTLENA